MDLFDRVIHDLLCLCLIAVALAALLTLWKRWLRDLVIVWAVRVSNNVNLTHEVTRRVNHPSEHHYQFTSQEVNTMARAFAQRIGVPTEPLSRDDMEIDQMLNDRFSDGGGDRLDYVTGRESLEPFSAPVARQVAHLPYDTDPGAKIYEATFEPLAPVAPAVGEDQDLWSFLDARRRKR